MNELKIVDSKIIMQTKKKLVVVLRFIDSGGKRFRAGVLIKNELIIEEDALTVECIGGEDEGS